LVGALVSATVLLSACGHAPGLVKSPAPHRTNPLVSNNSSGLNQAPADLGNLPTESSSAAPSFSPDFGGAAVTAVQPGSGAAIDESGAPLGVTPDGADYALNQAAHVRNQIIVKLKPGAAAYRVARFATKYGGTVGSDLDVGTHYQVINLPPGMSAEQGMQVYGSAPGVESVMHNRVYGADGIFTHDSSGNQPNDPYYSKQWGDDQISGPDAWAQNVDCSNIMVAVLDTGIDYRHPEFGNRIIRGWNFADNNNDVMDRFGHGTHVAGIIGAEGNNGVGVAGVAWNVKILAVKVLGDNGQGSTAAVVNGIKYAADMGARAINMSLGSPDTTIDPALGAAIAYARARGVLVICAAGNNHGDVGSPANDPGAIAVSSTSKFLWWEYLSWFSNRGSKIEVSAPGGGIWSTVPLDPNQTGATGYSKLSGTSMATPYVTGEAALIWGKHPYWTADQVHQVIDTAVDHKGASGRNDRYGFGRINLAKAVAS
jgi:thermitase